MKTTSVFTSVIVLLLYAGVCAAEDVSVLDDAILDYASHDYASHDPRTITASQYRTSDGKYEIVLDGAYWDYSPTHIKGLEEADVASFEEVAPEDLRVQD